MRYAHKVFHLDEHIEREELYKSINNYISQYSSELDVPTIKISCKKDLENYYKNSSIRFTNEGYYEKNIFGWKYGELGIWASNVNAYKKFLETDLDYLILMEDDIVYIDGFFENLILYMSQLPDAWDAFFYYNPSHYDDEVCFSPIDTNPLPSVVSGLSLNNSDICEVYQNWSMLCYIINRRSAKKILDDVTVNPINLPLDHYFLRQRKKYNSYTIAKKSKMYCNIAILESTFQNKQKREVLK